MRTSSYISRNRTRTPRNFPPINIFPHERGDFISMMEEEEIYLLELILTEQQHKYLPES